MSLRRWILFTLVCLCAVAVQAAPPVALGPGVPHSQFEDPDPVHIDQAIDALSSTNWRERRSAVRQLVKFGPAAQQRLEKLIESPVGPEARLRAQAALAQIIPQRRIEPALITRDFVDANVADTFYRVAEIEGAPLRCEPADLIRNIKHHITVQYQHELYWNVMLDLCRKSGLRLRCDERGVTIIKAGPRAKFDRFYVNGVLLITTPQATITGSTARLAVYAEPRARILRGKSVRIPGTIISDGQNLGNGYWWLVKRPGGMQSGLKGSVDVLLAESRPTLEAPGVSSRSGLSGPLPLYFSAGGVTTTIFRVVQTQAAYEIDMQLSIDPSDVDWDALLFSIRTGGLRVFDVDDRELSFVQLSCDGVGPINNLRLLMSPRSDLQTPPTGRPYKLMWNVPAKSVSTTSRFELADRVIP